MALSFSIEIGPPEEARLLAIARRSIERGLSRDESLQLQLQDLPEVLIELLQTLFRHGRNHYHRGSFRG